MNICPDYIKETNCNYMLSALSILKVYESGYLLSRRIEKKMCHANINYSLSRRIEKKYVPQTFTKG